MYTTIEECREALEAALSDTAGDNGIAVEDLDESAAYDLICAVAHSTDVISVRNEFLRTELGFIPQVFEPKGHGLECWCPKCVS